MYGQRLPIRSNKEYNLDEDKFFIIKENMERGERFWNFDEYGNPVVHAKNNELPLDYQTIGELYIKIKDLNINQDNIYPCICYTFQIYMYGSKKVVSLQFLPSIMQVYLYGDWDEATNNFAYTDIYDCLNDAITLIKYYKTELKEWFKLEKENYKSALIALNEKGEIIEGFND